MTGPYVASLPVVDSTPAVFVDNDALIAAATPEEIAEGNRLGSQGVPR